MTAAPLDDTALGTQPCDAVVIDPAIYPRAGGVQAETVARYADAIAAGDDLPPVILERGTLRLLDGHHRLAARIRLGLAEVGVTEHDVPAGWTAKLYAAHLQSTHGLPLVEQDEKALAREMYEQSEVAAATVAKALGRSRRTVDGWVTDLAEDRRAAEEHQRDVRRCLALLLREVGWTQPKIADTLGITQSGVSRMHDGGVAVMHTESVLRDAVAIAPDDVADEVAEIADRWREERIFSRWSQDERDILKRLRDGGTVVVNMRPEAHGKLWVWAEQAGLAVRVDRKSVWGNPFLLPDDGARDEVCDLYADVYWPHKPSLHAKIGSLAGRALGCWCAPARCHGDFLQGEATSC